MHLLLNCLRMKPRSYLACDHFSLVPSYLLYLVFAFLSFSFVCVAMDEVLSVIPNQYRKLHTTRSWDFIGLPLTAKRKLKSENDTIVALLDTGLSYLSSHFHFLFCISLFSMIDII